MIILKNTRNLLLINKRSYYSIFSMYFHDSKGANYSNDQIYQGIKCPRGSNIPGVKHPRGSNILGVKHPEGSNILGVKYPKGSNIPGVKHPEGSNIPGVKHSKGQTF